MEVGAALLNTGGLLEAGTIRVGGTDGEVIDVGSVARGRFLWALSLCHRAGPIRLPDDDQCQDAVDSFEQYYAKPSETAAPTSPARQPPTNAAREP